MDMRHVCAGIFEQFCDMQKRAAILMLWRSIHRNQRAAIAAGEADAEVTAEAGVGRSGCKGERAIRKLAVQPFG